MPMSGVREQHRPLAQIGLPHEQNILADVVAVTTALDKAGLHKAARRVVYDVTNSDSYDAARAVLARYVSLI
jgi:hypothetical protein